jgi:hypothetical protein
MLGNDFGAKLFTTKIMSASVAMLFAELAATATPAEADPTRSTPLGCSCDSAAEISAGNVDVKDQIDQGIQNGLGSLHLTRASVS